MFSGLTNVYALVGALVGGLFFCDSESLELGCAGFFPRAA